MGAGAKTAEAQKSQWAVEGQGMIPDAISATGGETNLHTREIHHET